MTDEADVAAHAARPTLDQAVMAALSAHYARPTLDEAIIAAVKASGIDPDKLTPEDLAPVDEAHIGGRQATIDLAEQLDLRPGMTLLDIGSGLGGASRYFAQVRDCRVHGVDLTADFVRVAELLAGRVGLADRVAYQQASALALPFASGMFDGATLMHVGMNIPDKRALFVEVKRVLKQGAVFGLYDVMRVGDGELAYPVPWATTSETNFIATPAAYRQDLEAAGFVAVNERNRRDFAIDYFRKFQAQTAAHGVTPLGVHLVLGKTALRQSVNIFANIQRGLVAPVEMVCRAG